MNKESDNSTQEMQKEDEIMGAKVDMLVYRQDEKTMTTEERDEFTIKFINLVESLGYLCGGTTKLIDLNGDTTECMSCKITLASEDAEFIEYLPGKLTIGDYCSKCAFEVRQKIGLD